MTLWRQKSHAKLDFKTRNRKTVSLYDKPSSAGGHKYVPLSLRYVVHGSMLKIQVQLWLVSKITQYFSGLHKLPLTDAKLGPDTCVHTQYALFPSVDLFKLETHYFKDIIYT